MAAHRLRRLQAAHAGQRAGDGDRNYLVGPRGLGERLHEERRLPRAIDQVLAPRGGRLVTLYDLSGNGCPSYRRRVASEMLYAMVEAGGVRAKRYRKEA